MTTKELDGDPVITVKLEKGLADRQRLPLAHVLGVLEELRQMIASVGRRIQRERGILNPSGDFGLEIIASGQGELLKSGSVQAPIALTSNTQTGVLAVQEVIRTLNLLEAEDGILDPNDVFDTELIRRVARIARIQKTDKVDLELSIQGPGFPEPITGRFGTAGISSIRALQSPTFQVEGMSLFGKLVELVDRDKSDEDVKGFWGELRRESGESWRVQFKQSDIDNVTPLFRKQVVVTGRAVYYRVATPKIIAETVSADTDRDFESAFDELLGCYKDTFKVDTKTLVRRMRDEE